MFLQLHPVLVFLHVVALAIGLGGAILADWIVISQLTFHRITPASAGRLADLSHAVIVGLALLWITGAALIAYQANVAPQRLLTNEKVWAKVAIVAVLTVNALLLHKVALPQVTVRVGQPLFAMTWRVLAPATLLAAISMTSWTFGGYLGAARELNNAVTLHEVFEAYGAAVLSAWVVTFTLACYGREAAHNKQTSLSEEQVEHRDKLCPTAAPSPHRISGQKNAMSGTPVTTTMIDSGSPSRA